MPCVYAAHSKAARAYRQLSPHPLQIRADVNAEVEEAKKGEWPPTEFLWKNTYKDGLGSKMRPMEIGLEKIPV